MNPAELTPEHVILSRWNSQGRLAKIISVGLIFVYILGLIYGSVMSISPESSRLLILWPGVFVYIACSCWMAAVIASNISPSFKKQPRTKKAICLLLPSMIIALYSTFVFAIWQLLLSDKEEESNFSEGKK